MYAPISGILFTDYFLLRGQKLNLWSIFDDDPSGEYHYTKGFNWIALGSLVLGQATYLFLYNPITGETHELFQWAPASIAAFVVPALVYGLAMRLLNVQAAAAARVAGSAAAGGRRLIAPNI